MLEPLDSKRTNSLSWVDMITVKMTKILNYLKEKDDWASPTDIAMAIGGYTASGLMRHSSWASPTCLSLVRQGILERNDKGHYRVKKNA